MAIEGSEGKVPQTEEKFSPPVFKKKTLIFVIAGVLLTLASLFVFARVRTHLAQRGLDQMVQEWDRMQKEYEAAQMADTYGGETPQETLRMFIEAMEKEDYELASKYFVISRQKLELEDAKAASRENIENILGMLRECLEKMENNPLEEVGGYSFDKTGYLIEEPIMVDFVMYPNGIWKIEEI